MTKVELIKALTELPYPDSWDVKIQCNQWIPGNIHPSEEVYNIHQVSVLDEGEIVIEFNRNDLP